MKPQTIRYFNRDTDLPLTLGLLVDVSLSQRDAIDDERTASFAFLDDTLTGPAGRDKAFIVQFARQTDLLQDVTSSKPKAPGRPQATRDPSLRRRLRHPGKFQHRLQLQRQLHPRAPCRGPPSTTPSSSPPTS
jgi:hypothetical protein